MASFQYVARTPQDIQAEEHALTTDVQAQLSNLPDAITDLDTYRKAKESLPLLKRAEDKVVAFFRDMKEAANKAHRSVCDKERTQLQPIAQARQRVAGLIYGFEREQDRIRRQQEQQAAAALKRQQDAEALAAAQELADQGAPEMAEQVLEQAIATPAPVVVLPSQSVAVAGVTIRENWQYVYAGGSPGQKWKDLTDEQRKRVLALLPREYLMPDEAALGKVVKALKSGTKIPGVQAYDAGTVAVRG